MIPRDVIELLILAILAVIDSRYVYGFPGRRDSVNSYTMEVPGAEGYIYIRIWRGQEITLDKALNMGGAPNPNILLRMERRNGKLVVVDADPSHALSALGENVAMANVPKHRHFIGSGMEDPVEGRRILPGLISPAAIGGLNVKIEPFHHPGGYFAGDDDFTIDDPASNYAAVGVYVDISTNTAGYIVGSTHTTPSDITDVDLYTDLAAHPIGIVPCGAVIVQSGQTNITSADTFLDWRFHNDSDAASSLDVAGIASATPALADKALFGDVSASDALRYATWQSIFNLVDLLTAETAPAVGDKVPLYDVSASNTDYITLANLFKVIDGLTSETAPATADKLALYDTSASSADSITLANLFKVIGQFSALTLALDDKLAANDTSASDAAGYTTPNAILNLVSALSSATPVAADLILFADASASNLAKQNTILEVVRAATQETSITSTGTQNNLDVGSSLITVVRLNNASDLTITGFANPAQGRRLILVSVGAGNVFLRHDDGSSSTAANRLNNDGFVTSVDLPLVAGKGRAEYIYDDTTDRWRLISYEQGEAITYTPTWSKASGTSPTLGDGILSGSYNIIGNLVQVAISFAWGSTTNANGTENWRFSLLIPLAGGVGVGGAATDVSLGAVNHVDHAQISATTLAFVAHGAGQIRSTVPFTWATGDALVISGWYRA